MAINLRQIKRNEYIVSTATFTPAKNHKYLLDSTAGGFMVDLPDNWNIGDRFTLYTAQVSTNPVVVTAPGGDNLNGFVQEVDLTEDYRFFEVVYTAASDWRMSELNQPAPVAEADRYIRKTAAYTVKPEEKILADTAAGDFDITLPDSPGTIGDWVTIQSTGTNRVRILRNGSTIDGEPSTPRMVDKDSYTLVRTTTTNWDLIRVRFDDRKGMTFDNPITENDDHDDVFSDRIVWRWIQVGTMPGPRFYPVRRFGGNLYVAVGRGREGWNFQTLGQNPGELELEHDLKAIAAFAPAAMASDDVQAITNGANLDFPIYIERAVTFTMERQSDAAWQLCMIDLNDNQAFDWSRVGTWPVQRIHYAESYYAAARSIAAGTLNDYLEAGNNEYRIMTRALAIHNNQRGFSFGLSVAGSTDPDHYMWVNASENHAIPQTIVYVPAF